MGRRVPGVKLLIERFASLPDGEGQVQQLAHGVADGDGLLVGMLLGDAGIESADGGIATNGAESGHPEIAPHQIVAAPRHDVAFDRPRPAVAVDAGADFDGHDAEIGDQLVRRLETVDVENEGGQHRGSDRADAGNRVETVWRGQGAIGVR